MARPARWIGLWLVGGLLWGCGGSAGLKNGVYSDDEADYRLPPLSAGWRRLDVERGNDLAWEQPRWSAVLQVNASCTPDLDVPLKALTQQLIIGFTARRILGEDLRPLDGREALWTHLRARVDGVEREMLLVVVKKNGCVYDFALVAGPGKAFRAARADFDPWVAGFRTAGRR